MILSIKVMIRGLTIVRRPCLFGVEEFLTPEGKGKRKGSSTFDISVGDGASRSLDQP